MTRAMAKMTHETLNQQGGSLKDISSLLSHEEFKSTNDIIQGGESSGLQSWKEIMTSLNYFYE
uniref:Uncharacterized protein n=1 Tax=Lupinus angustifolius TaxID=3871 RepID=L0P0W2_LUPAN|nr:hypothetical protein [Lupinus angustifolius]